VLDQLDQALTALSAAYKSGNLAAIGADEAKVQQLAQTYLQLRGSATPSPTATPSAPVSTTPSPTPS